MPYWYCDNSSFYLQIFDLGNSDDVAVIAVVDVAVDLYQLVLDLIAAAAAEQNWDYCLRHVAVVAAAAEVINPNENN